MFQRETNCVGAQRSWWRARRPQLLLYLPQAMRGSSPGSYSSTEEVIANVRVLRAEGISVSGSTLFVELAREDGGGAYTTQALPSPCWNETLRLPVGDGLGRVKVSLREGARLTEEDLVEPAFHGKELPSPLGWVIVSLAEVRGLDETRTFHLEGVKLNDEHRATVTLGFTFEERVAAEAVTSAAAVATRPSASGASCPKNAGNIPSEVAPTSVGAPQQSFSDDENPDVGEVRVPAETESRSAGEASEISEEFTEADGSSGGGVSDGGDDDGGGDLEISRRSLSPHGPEGGAGRPLELMGAGRRLGGGGTRGNEGETGEQVSDEGKEEAEDPAGAAEEGTNRNDAAGFGRLAPSFSGSSDEDEALEGYARGSCHPALDTSSPGGPDERSCCVANIRNLPRHGHTNPCAGEGRSSSSTPLSAPQCALSGFSIAADGGIAGGDQGGGGGGRERRARHSGETAKNGGTGGRTDVGEVLTGRTARDREGLRFEALRATVAATVAAVAQETLSESLRSGFDGSNSTSETTTSGTGNINTTSSFGTARRIGLGLPFSGSRSPPPASPLPGRSAASYFEGVASQSERNRSAERDGVPSSSSDEGLEGSLPLAGSRSPPPSSPLPARREIDSSDGESLERTRRMRRRRGVAGRKGSNSSGSTGGHRFMGSLPLAGSRSPPASLLPGRRSPDTASCYSKSEAKEEEENGNTGSRSPWQQSLSTAVLQPPIPQASLKMPRATVSPERRERRRKRRSDQEHHHALPQAFTTQLTAAATAGGPRADWLFSEASSAPLDLLSTLSDSRAAVGDNGTKLRRASTQGRGGAKGKQERTRGRASIPSSWETAGSTSPMHGATKRGQSERKHAEEAVGPGVTSGTPADAGAGRRGGGDSGRKPLGFTKNRKTGDHVASTKLRKTVGGWRRERGGHWVASAGPVTARRRAGEAHVREHGLRSTHFAPGYLGVAWPDPLDSGAAAQDSAEAKERLLARLEDAANRKLCEVEERTQRARRELSDRRKRRNLLLEQNTRMELQKAIEMQGRRLQRQLEAAKRRQAGAQAAADAAAVAAATRHSTGDMHINAGKTTTDPGGANPARVDRGQAVRRRRLMLQVEKERLKIEALKRKGEVKAQSLLQEISNAPKSDDAADGKVHASGAAATILASASITEGVGSRAIGKAAGGKGAVLGGGPPRSTLESWSEQRRAKAEELRASLVAEEAFETLKVVAELRRQTAVDERRDRARESNARADEGHGRACKRACMQVESKAARLVARAREAQWSAAMFAAEAAKEPTRARARANMRGRSIDGALRRGRTGSLRARSHDARMPTSSIGRESPARSTKVQHERGRERSRLRQDRDDMRPGFPAADETSSLPPSPPEVLCRHHDGRSESHATGMRERERAAGATGSLNHRNRQSQLLVEVLDEAKAVIDGEHADDASGVGPEGRNDCRRDTEKSTGGGRRERRNEVWVPSGADEDEGTGLGRRLQHLDDLTARLEDTEAELAAKLDRFDLNGVARTVRRDGSGGRRRRFARDLAPGVIGDAGRGRFGDELSPRRRTINSAAGRRRTSNASRALGRLAASTISSTLKAKPAPGLDSAGRGGNGKCSSKSPIRCRKGDSSRLPKGSFGRPNNIYCSAGHLGKDDTVGGGDRVDGRGTAREERSTRVRRRATAKDKRRVDDTDRREGAVPPMDDPQHCSDWSGAEIRLRSADSRQRTTATGDGFDETKHDADRSLRNSGQEKMDSVWSARASNSLREGGTSDELGGNGEAERVGLSSGRRSTRKAAGSNRHANNGSQHEHSILRGQHDDGEADTYREQSASSNSGSRVRTNSKDSAAYYESGDHKEALESVSKEAFRMREIKDDLTTVLRRLQESDRLAAAVDPPEPRFGRDAIDGGTKGGGDDEDEAATLARAFCREDVVPKEAESGPVFWRQQQDVQPTTPASAVLLQASALADLEARIASLGGLLSGYASGLSSSIQSPERESPRSLRSPSLSPSSSPQQRTRPFDSPHSLAENSRNNRRVHANHTVKDDDWRRDQAAAEKNSQCSGDGDGDGSTSGSKMCSRDAVRDIPSTRAVSYSASSSAGWASSGSAGGGPASATASVASALAREVEALLHSGGGGIDTGDYGGTGLGDARSVIKSSGGGGGCGEVGQKAFVAGYTDNMGDSGWATLEGMAERLGALVGDSGGVFSATSASAGGASTRGGSVYSSSRGVASVSSVGSRGPDVGRSVIDERV